MKYKVTWKINQEKWLSVITMFSSMTRKERADAGKGVKLIGRWHDVVAREGVAILEGKSLADVSRYLGKWNPHMDMTVAPVMEDNDAAAFCRRVVADNKA